MGDFVATVASLRPLEVSIGAGSTRAHFLQEAKTFASFGKAAL